MIEELKNKIGKIPNNRDSELSYQFDRSMKAIKEMKKNAFYRNGRKYT